MDLCIGLMMMMVWLIIPTHGCTKSVVFQLIDNDDKAIPYDRSHEKIAIPLANLTAQWNGSICAALKLRLETSGDQQKVLTISAEYQRSYNETFNAGWNVSDLSNSIKSLQVTQQIINGNGFYGDASTAGKSYEAAWMACLTPDPTTKTTQDFDGSITNNAVFMFGLVVGGLIAVTLIVTIISLVIFAISGKRYFLYESMTSPTVEKQMTKRRRKAENKRVNPRFTIRRSDGTPVLNDVERAITQL